MISDDHKFRWSSMHHRRSTPIISINIGSSMNHRWFVQTHLKSYASEYYNVLLHKHMTAYELFCADFSSLVARWSNFFMINEYCKRYYESNVNVISGRVGWEICRQVVVEVIYKCNVYVCMCMCVCVCVCMISSETQTNLAVRWRLKRISLLHGQSQLWNKFSRK